MLWPIYALGVAALLAHGPEELLVPGSPLFVAVIGAIAIWRYGWGLLHHLRAFVYRSFVFPRIRAILEDRQAAALAGGAPSLGELYIVITAYRIPAHTVADALRLAVEEAIHCGCPTVVVASIVEPGDERMIKTQFQRLQPPQSIRLALTRLQPGGKRLALGAALRAVARCHPAADAAVVVMDGDTLLTKGSIRNTAPLLSLMPSIGAVTTDEAAIADEESLQLRWHRLRFAQRHVLMSSLGLSGRLLVLTGRMSIFRASIATDPDFIRRIEQDSLDHWRLGNIPLLTGEDKSTWLWLLERDYLMLYVPDVQILTREHPPNGHFLGASVRLMVRWFGNMLRANGRALALGPRRIGLFPWWCLVDQRISMWTPLVGPIAVAFLAATHSPEILYAYGIWLIVSRCILAAGLFLSHRSIDSAWPLLILFNQLVGSLVKTWVLFRLDRQRWTRQEIGTPRPRRGSFSARNLMSDYLHLLAMLALIVAIGFATGGLSLPTSFSVGMGNS